MKAIANRLTQVARMAALAFAVGLAGSAWAATPVAVWDGDFSTMTKGTYTLSENGNTKTDSYLQISGNNGVLLTSTSAINVFTVIVRCEGLNLGAANTQVLFTSYGSANAPHDNKTGVTLPANNAVCRGIWEGADWNNGATQGSVPANYTTIIYNHRQTNGTYAYALGPTSDSDNTVKCTTLYSVVGLRSSGTTYSGCAIGGLRGTTSTTLLPATGLKIKSLAVFSGTLTESEMKGYAFPSEMQTINVSSDTSVSALNQQIASVGSSIRKVTFSVADGVTINIDAAFSTSIPVSVESTGSVTLSAATQPDLSAVSFDVKGSLIRSWLIPGVVGFNFRSANGSDVSGALAAGTNWIHDNNSANGSSTAMFADGLSTLTWSSANTWSCSGSTIISGYLDDGSNGGNGAVVKLSNVPYETYDVIIYASSDSNPGSFLKKTVNGKTYTWNSVSGEVIQGDGAWGKAALSIPVYGVNALRIRNLTGALTIYGTSRNGSQRGGIAAIQIMPPETPDNIRTYTLTLNGTATNWSTGNWTLEGNVVDAPTSGYVEIVATASTELTVDTAVSLAKLTIKGSNNAVVKVNNGASGSLYAINAVVESGVFQQGSAAVLGATPNIVVANGGTFDLNGLAINGSNNVKIEGSGAGSWPWALTSSGGEFPVNTLKTLTLTGNATIGGANKINFGNTGEACTLDLAGFTLTKTGTGEFAFTNGRCKSGSTGTIDITAGLVSMNYWCNLDGSKTDGKYASTTVIVREGAEFKNNSSDRAIVVDTLLWRGGSVTGGFPFAVTRAFEGSGTVSKLQLANNVEATLTGELNVTTLSFESISNNDVPASPSFVKGANASSAAVNVTDSITLTDESEFTVGAGVTWNVPMIFGANATIVAKDGATIVAVPTTTSADYYIKATSGEGETVYSVAEKYTLTLTTGENVTVAGVTDGQRVAPGDTFTVTATPDEYYTASVVVTGATNDNGTYTVGENNVTVAVTATRNMVDVTVPVVTGAQPQTATSNAGEVIPNDNGTFSVPAGSTLTITWATVGNYILDATTTTFEVGSEDVTLSGTGLATPVAAVAKVGDTLCKTLQAAIDGASSDAANPSTVTLLQDIGADTEVTLNKTIVFVENSKAFGGKLKGNGAIKITTAPSTTTWNSSRFSATANDNWTGTFVMAWTDPNASNAKGGAVVFDNYGITGSTVLMAANRKGFLKKNNTENAAATVAPVVKLGAVLETADGYSSSTAWANLTTIASLESTEAGELKLAWTPANNAKGHYFIESLEYPFPGKITVGGGYRIKIGKLNFATAEAMNAAMVPGTQLVSATVANGGGIFNNENTPLDASTAGIDVAVAGVVQAGIKPIFDTDGIYVPKVKVEKAGVTTYYMTTEAAMTAAGSDAATITLLADAGNTSDVSLAIGQTLVAGSYTVGTVTTPSVNGVNLVEDSVNKTWKVVDNRTSTWDPKNNSTDWNVAANWSTGFVPTQYTDVTFPSGTWQVTVNSTVSLKSMTLTGAASFTGNGKFSCLSADSIQGTMRGTVTVEYPEKTLPTGATWTDEDWAGTLVLTNCGREKVAAHGVVHFNNYGNKNSKIKAPGYKGVSADVDQNTLCEAELVIDGGTEFEFNHGNVQEDATFTKDGAGFRFAKLSGAGKLTLDGTTDRAQYIFNDVTGFTGDMLITFPAIGGRKSFIFGADKNWKIESNSYPANLVIAGNVTVGDGENARTWDIPAGIIIESGKTLTLNDKTTITALSPRSEGTLKLASGATATLTGVTNGVVTATLDIPSGATLKIADASLTRLTIPAGFDGDVNLEGCTALTELHIALGTAKEFDLGKIKAVPSTCTLIYYDIGAIRDLNGYTVPSVGTGKTFRYYAAETDDEFAGSNFVVTNVPDGAQVWLARPNGALNKADPTSEDSTVHKYTGGSVFAATACWHEWDFEQTPNPETGVTKLDDSGKGSVKPDEVAPVKIQTDDVSFDYYTTGYGEESKQCIPAAVHPRAASDLVFGDNWSAAVRCSLPTAVGTVGISFGDTTTGVIGLATGTQSDVVELFTWTSTGGYVTLARLEVESPANKDNMHIYVFIVEGTKVSFYRDGEFIHKATLPSAITVANFMVGDVKGRTSETQGLPAAITSGDTASYVDYVRLYNTVLDESIPEALSKRRPFESAYKTFERTVDEDTADWSAATAAWISTANADAVACPLDGTNVTLTAKYETVVAVNLDNDIAYNTVIIKGDDKVTLVPETGKTGAIKARMFVARTPVVVRYGTADLSTAMVGVDEGASLTFDLSDYPFETEVTTTKNVQLTGVVVAHSYDESVEDRISVIGAPDTRFFTIDGDWNDEGHYFYATITRNYKTFTVEVPDNMVVTVNGDLYTEGTPLSFANDAQVTIAYTAADGYVATGYASQTVTAGVVTGDAIAATAGTVTKAVAFDGTTYYTSLAAAIAGAPANSTVTLLANETANAEKTTTNDRLVVTKPLTIDFGEFTYTVPGELEPTANWSAFYIDADVIVTGTTGGVRCVDKLETPVEGEYCGVFAFTVGKNVPGASLTIDGGVYHGGGTIAQVDSGLVTVNGGTFTATPFVDPVYGMGFVFNCNDAAYQAGNADFDIKGGTFVGFDPQSNKAEGENTDFTAEGFIAVEDANTPGKFGVVPGWVITFVDEDGTTLDTQRVKAGETPDYGGETPTKTATAQYTYTFARWSPAIEAASATRTYSATYSATVNTYTIKWVVEGVETSETLAYGVTPTKADPVKASTAEWIYTFTGWTPEVATVTGDATYTAQFSKTPNTVTFSLPEVTTATATVTGATQNQDGSYTATIGDTVTITWTATGANIWLYL